MATQFNQQARQKKTQSKKLLGQNHAILSNDKTCR